MHPFALSDMATSIPIFPLNTVLYPGGMLPLRIFEQRYLEMTRLPARHNALRRMPHQ